MIKGDGGIKISSTMQLFGLYINHLSNWFRIQKYDSG
jgi:hypothetical protein